MQKIISIASHNITDGVHKAASLTSRIRWRDVGAGVTLNGEPAPLRSDYINTIDEVTQLAAMGKKVQRKRDSNAPYSPDNDMDIYKLSAQLTIINRDNIHSIGELEGKIENLKAEYEKARKELNQLTSKQDSMDSLIEQAECYFELVDKPQLTLSEKLKLNICRQAINGSNIQNRADLERIKSAKQETNKKIAALKYSFENCKQLYEVYADIASTYYQISNGDYISKLIEEEKRRLEREEDRKKRKSL